MSTLAVTLTPGYTFTAGELVTIAKLNLLATPTVNLIGSISSTSIADGSITTPKIATAALAASTAGRSKMEDGFFTADATGRAKFASGFVTYSMLATDANATGAPPIGSYRTLTAQNSQAAAVSVASITRSSNTATATRNAHGFVVGQLVTIAGCDQPEYNGTFLIITVTTNTFTFNVVNAPVTPATGTITVTTAPGSSTSKVDVAAADLVVKDSSAEPVCLATVSVTIDTAGSGANGIDTGTVANQTWYYAWIIYKSSDGTMAGLLSKSATAPTLPAGYTHKALVSVVRYGAGGLDTFYQVGRKVWINETNLFSGAGPASANTYETLTGLSMVAPNAREVFGTAGASTSGGGGLTLAGNASGLGAVVLTANVAGSSTSSFFWAAGFKVPVFSQSIAWKARDSAGSYRINIAGFEL